MRIPFQAVQNLHFVGIGGIGMSGIAEVLHNLGYSVKGSDTAENHNTQRLRTMGIGILIGHQASHIAEAQVVVCSSAIRRDNPEVLAAREKGIPVIQRAEMLAELIRLKFSIAVSGTHGKTTTTSLIAALMEAASLDPTVINGGILNAYNTNARLGEGEWAVVEADESDGSFTKFSSTIVVVTNIDLEHMEHYGTLESLKKSFAKFIQNIPFYGLAVLCADHPHVTSLIPTLTDRRIVTYGFHEASMIRGLNLRRTPKGTTFDVTIQLQQTERNRYSFPLQIKDIFLPMVGDHNVQNALSLVAIAQELRMSEEVLRKALTHFQGVKRRFTITGVSGGITFIDDYAHHPVEIKTVITAARQYNTSGNLIVIVQPHRYSRLRDLFDDFVQCFSGCDRLVIAPVYGAGEGPLPEINSASLAAALRERKNFPIDEIQSEEEIPSLLKNVAHPGDTVLLLGAGSITNWANVLPSWMDGIWSSYKDVA